MVSYLVSRTKKYCSFPFDKWKQKFQLGISSGRVNNETKLESVKTGKTAIIQGQHAEEYFVNVQPDKWHAPGAKSASEKPAPEKRKRSHPLTVKDIGAEYLDLWVTSQIHPPSQFSYLLQSMMGIPADKGFPLKVIRHPGHNKPPLVVLDTIKVEQKPVAKSEFEMPKGLKQVENEMQLLINEDEDIDSDSETKGDSGTAKDKSVPPDGSTQSPPPAAKPWWQVW